ncbi:MAG: hypothetical protein IBX55_13065 [Methyloprofundus sp.]|nr:hypothetical protein [Methyloprofundus sp.]
MAYIARDKSGDYVIFENKPERLVGESQTWNDIGRVQIVDPMAAELIIGKELSHEHEPLEIGIVKPYSGPVTKDYL